MSKYKKIMSVKGIQQKEVLAAVRRVDMRVDKSLLSKIVNDVCLPTPTQFQSICDTLVCKPYDVYDPCEVKLMGNNRNTAQTRRRRQNIDVYNLTVEIPCELAERVFAPEALRKLGYLSKSDAVRHLVYELDARLSAISKEADDNNNKTT